MSIRCAPRCFR